MILLKGKKKSKKFKDLSISWLELANETQYTYSFDWLGRPIIQLPQDIVQIQHLIWKIKPDLIIETGIAHGGSLILSASIQALNDYENAKRNDNWEQLKNPKSKVIGIDIDIRNHNKLLIESHPFYKNRISMIEGSSIDKNLLNKINKILKNYKKLWFF